MITRPRLHQACVALANEQQHLRTLELPEGACDDLIRFVEVIVFRSELGGDRPLLIGMMGCTGTGKSTLFNSLVGQECSEISWKAHNTLGPVVWAHAAFQSALDEIESTERLRFFPRWQRQVHTDNSPNLAGTTEHLNVVWTTDDTWRHALLIDLPDINTTRSHREKQVAESLQPWLDVCLFVMDEETLFHREYNRPVQLSRQLQQQMVAVLNHRGRDQYVEDDPDMDTVRQYFGVETLHTLPVLTGENHFTDQPGFRALRDALQEKSRPAPTEPLLDQARPHARLLLSVLQRRWEQFAQLEDELGRHLSRRPRRRKAIPLRGIMHDDVLQVLDNMGLRRLSLSNLYNFGKRVSTSTRWLRSFHLSFGSQRIHQLEHLLRFDEDKLLDAVMERVNDRLEAIQNHLARQEDLDELLQLAPDMVQYALRPAETLKPRLRAILDQLEQETRTLLEADTVRNAVRQDPLTTLGVILVMVLDIVTIPGTGTFALVPSVTYFLPLGPFEKVKRRFQQQVHEVVEEQVQCIQRSVDEARERLTLSPQSSLMQAIQVVADHDA